MSSGERASCSASAFSRAGLARVAIGCALTLLAACASDTKREQPSLAGFIWPMKGVIAEGVAFDPVTRDFFVSSVRERRIWRVTPDGEFHDFAGPDMRLLGAFGLTIDSGRRVLWVASSRVPQSTGFGSRPAVAASVIGFDLRDGDVGFESILQSEGEHVLGDVAVGPDGSVWATDSRTPGLYRWELHREPDLEFAGGLQRVPWGDDWRNPQGLAFSERGELFVADYPRGIARVDTVAGSHALLKGSEERLRGVDGLYWHDGALYAIQNGTQTHRVLRIALDATRTAVERIDILLEGPPLDDPTLGVFADGAFFVNAASGWGDYTETGERANRPGRPLTEHRVVRIELEGRR
ncbi:MAG: hypothetical protein HZA52_02975 [Planctomycetes bacterium]|nr:hypothetical protein [Planctomycetota bacterium]